jgi:hypothetical protein
LIKWIAYNPKKPPANNKAYLVSDGHKVDTSIYDDDGVDWKMVNGMGLPKEKVTHYAEINLPNYTR